MKNFKLTIIGLIGVSIICNELFFISSLECYNFNCRRIKVSDLLEYEDLLCYHIETDLGTITLNKDNWVSHIKVKHPNVELTHVIDALIKPDIVFKNGNNGNGDHRWEFYRSIESLYSEALGNIDIIVCVVVNPEKMQVVTAYIICESLESLIKRVQSRSHS